MNTKSVNTPTCWSCSAPFRIEFASDADIERFSREHGIVHEAGNTFRVTAGIIRQGYKTAHLSLYLFRRHEPILIPHEQVLRVADLNSSTIWENTELKTKKC